MPLNELGQTVNNAGNILCLKIGTTKKQYLSPHTVKNAELMKLQGWEIVMQPELPPSFSNGKNNYSAGSYEENNSQGTTTTGPKGEYNLNQPEEIKQENQEANNEAPSEFNNIVEFGNDKIESTIPATAKITAIKNYALEPGGKKRGRPFGSTTKKKSKSKK